MPRTKTSGQGRPKGVPNKVTRPVRELAANFSEHAIGVLVRIMADFGAPHAARVAAAREVLDRAHGRPATSVQFKLPTGDLDEQAEAIVQAAASGTVAIEHAQALMGMLDTQAKIHDATDLRARLEAVEQLLAIANESSPQKAR